MAKPPRKAKATDAVSAAAYERSLPDPAQVRYVLRLYVTGLTPRSQRAIANIQKLCEQHMSGRYELEIIDIYQEPERAKGDQILAVPTLIKKLPLPLRRIIGDLSSPGSVMVALGMKVE